MIFQWTFKDINLTHQILWCNALFVLELLNLFVPWSQMHAKIFCINNTIRSHILQYAFYALFFRIAANTPPNYIISSNHPHFWRHEKWDYSNHPQRPILQQSPPYTSSVLKWFLAHFITTANTPLSMLRLQQSPP